MVFSCHVRGQLTRHFLPERGLDSHKQISTTYCWLILTRVQPISSSWIPTHILLQQRTAVLRSAAPQEDLPPILFMFNHRLEGSPSLSQCRTATPRCLRRGRARRIRPNRPSELKQTSRADRSSKS